MNSEEMLAKVRGRSNMVIIRDSAIGMGVAFGAMARGPVSTNPPSPSNNRI